MKKLDKKDMPKLIALVVVAVLVFGFAVWQFMPKTSAGSSPAAGSTPSVATTGTTAAVPAGSETTASQPEAPQPFDVRNVQILTGGKDPFVPNGPAAPALPGQVSAPQQTQPASKPVKVAQREPSLGIPSPGTLPISGGGGGGRPGTPPRFNRLPEAEPQQRRPAPVVAVALPPPPPPTFVVTGVVRGEQEDIVILRDGDERRFVRVGDPVGNGFKVTAVLEDGVEIGSGSRRVILKLGGTLLVRNKSLVGAVGLLALLPGVIELPASAAGTTNVVTGVKVNSEGDFTRIIVTGTEAFRPALRSLGNRPGTLINIPGVWGRDNNGYVRVGRNGVGGVRYGALDEVDADGVSIVANTRGYRPYSTRASEGGKRWEIKLWRKAPSTGRRARAVSVAVAPQRIASATRRLSAAPLVSADGERRISLDFVGADINDVLKALAMQADVNIVTAADVKGNITVSLNRVTVPEALDMVARLSGYQYAKVGPAYVVGTDKSVAALGANAAEPAAEPVTEVIPYRFMQTAELGKALAERFPGMKLSNGNDEKSASKQRMLVLTDTPERVAAARTFVERLEQAISLPTVGAATEVYRVRYTSPTDLISILARLVPTVQVTLGPAQGFQSGSSGASAAFASSPAEGSGASAGAGGGAASTGGGAGTSNPAGAVNSGGAPNTLLLTGATSDIVRAREVLESIDVRAPQMVFEARVMDIGSTDFSRIGLSYDFSRGVNIGETDRETPTIEGIGARRPNFGAILRTPYSIGVNLDLLAQNGQARLLANPNISALDGQPAVVFIGDQIKYVIRQEVTPTGTNIQTETATVGITLKVTGKASPDGTITLYVHPEVSVISGFLTVGNGISLPQIATRFVDTTIRVRDGETIAIGGLIRESDITNIQKVPFLGDLPFLGQLFRRTEKNKSRSEVVVFLTSRVLKD